MINVYDWVGNIPCNYGELRYSCTVKLLGVFVSLYVGMYLSYNLEDQQIKKLIWNN